MAIKVYEVFKDYLNPFKPFCVSTDKGYFSFYTKEDMLLYLKELGLNSNDIKKLNSAEVLK